VLRAEEVRVKVAMEGERVKATAKAERVRAAAEAECVKAAAETEAAEQAVYWVTEMDKALAYRRDVERNIAETERHAGRRNDTEDHVERRMTVRRQEAAIRAAMAAIEAADVGGTSTEAPCSRETAAVAT
jgi:hypothetical protein